MDYKYDVFLSYSSYDNIYSKDIIEELSKNNITIFNQKSIGAGEAIISSIENAIEESEHFIFICSSSFLRKYHKELMNPNESHTSHVSQEIKFALKEAASSGLNIIPVIITSWGDTTIVSLVNNIFPNNPAIIYGDINKTKKELSTLLTTKKEIKNLFALADQSWIYGAYEQAYNYYLTLAHKLDKEPSISCYNRAAQCCEKTGRFQTAKKLYELANNFEAIQKIENSTNKQKDNITPNENSENRVLLEKIANYCNASIDLFYELLKNNGLPESVNCLETSYSRLLNYCKTIGNADSLITDIISKSNIKIKELKAQVDTTNFAKSNTKQHKNVIKSYRTYLGLDFPESDNYDVFISYKSEDEKYARRVYEFLLNEGKKAFFACEVLPEMGKTEYRDAIMDALDHSQHFVLVTSKLDYITSNWVKEEWSFFISKLIEDGHKGNFALIELDSTNIPKVQLPPNIRYKQRFKLSNYKESLIKYLQQ